MTSDRDEAVLPVPDHTIKHGVQLAVVGLGAVHGGERGTRLARARHGASTAHRRAMHAQTACIVTAKLL